MEPAKPSLDFQDFGYRLPTTSPLTKAAVVGNKPLTTSPSEDDDTFVRWPDGHSDQDQLLGGRRGVDADANGAGVRRDRSSYFSFSYYQSFFDVDTRDIITRLGGALLPLPKYLHKSFLEEHVRVNPDFYGPFWICITLVFSIAIAGNIANYIQYQGEYDWKYDFHKVSLAATMVVVYCVVLPFLLYMFLWSRQLATRISLIELFCLYGYSLTVFVPVSVLWALNIRFLQWVLLFVAVSISGYVLSTSIWHAVRSDNTNMALAVAAITFFLQFLMAALLMFFFFSGAPSTPPLKSGHYGELPLDVKTNAIDLSANRGLNMADESISAMKNGKITVRAVLPSNMSGGILDAVRERSFQTHAAVESAAQIAKSLPSLPSVFAAENGTKSRAIRAGNK